MVKDNPRLFEDISAEGPMVSKDHMVLNIPPQNNGNDSHVEEVQDISHETEDDTLSIEKKEKELIIRALRKNNNKRKYAARDLGISERTLYRKIKQYELEE
jgi:transcriptional regulator with PAS, ATPase and Fis domain